MTGIDNSGEAEVGPETIDLVDLDATAQAELVRSRQLTARQLVEATLSRIEAIDPSVNAFRIVLSERALAQADEIDALPHDRLDALPLAGVPVAIKDDTDVAGESTMWGSSVDRGPARDDADIVRHLRQAGAVIIGKTNTPELTLWPWTSSEPWGVTRNPWNVERTPGGSSGGSAAAVCTGMAAMALGSDGGGSVRYPAGLTGLVGLKPQRDRVPVGPEHLSGWHGLIVLGPLTRSIRDAALFLDVVAPDENGFVEALQTSIPPLRIAISTNAPTGSQVRLSPARRAHVEHAAQLFAELGHRTHEAKIHYGLNALWSSTVRLLKGVQQDVAAMPNQGALEARTRAVARLGWVAPNRSLRSSQRKEASIATRINRVFQDADVVLTPLCASSAPMINRCPDRGAIRSLLAANTSAWLVPWNLTGQPALVIPTGLDDEGLPTAVQLVGTSGSEATLLALANQIEHARPFPQWAPV